MIIRFRKQFDKDTGCMSGFELDADGFIPTWAYLTGDEKKCYWEFDIVHKKSNIDSHVSIPWTTSVDLIETILRNELEGLDLILCGFAKESGALGAE